MGTVPNTFATMTGGNVPAADLDSNFAALVGISGTIPTGHVLVMGSSNNATDGGLPATLVPNTISGFLPTAISGTSTTAAVTISLGQASDSTNAVFITTSGNTAWAVSNGNAINGYAGGTTLPNSSTIHFFVCNGTSGTGTFASTSLTPTFPTGYTTYNRRIFELVTNSSGALIVVVPHEISGGGVELAYASALGALDYNSTPATAARALITLTVPIGIIVKVMANAGIAVPAGGAGTIWISDPAANDVAPSAGTNTPLGMLGMVAASSDQVIVKIEQWTNTSAQIGVRSSTASTSLEIQTLGWIDPRRT